MGDGDGGGRDDEELLASTPWVRRGALHVLVFLMVPVLLGAHGMPPPFLCSMLVGWDGCFCRPVGAAAPPSLAAQLQNLAEQLLGLLLWSLGPLEVGQVALPDPGGCPGLCSLGLSGLELALLLELLLNSRALLNLLLWRGEEGVQCFLYEVSRHISISKGRVACSTVSVVAA